MEAGNLCGGVARELRQRGRYCRDDYLTGLRYLSKTLSAALFMFFATLFSTVALGALIEKKTGSRIGLTEYLTANSFAGVAHALFGAQPLLVLRPTGPITAITCKLSETADQLGLDFHQYLAATGVCIALLMGLIAATELSRHITRLTPFTHDIFACFVCSIYVSDGVVDIIGRFDDSTTSTFAGSLFTLNLALITAGASLWLAGASRWSVGPARLRTIIADYAVTIAVLLTTLVSYTWKVAAADVRRISLPGQFGPTCFHELHSAHTGATPPCAHATASDLATVLEAGGSFAQRPWLVGLPGLEPYLWFISFLSAVPITFFFYMDQNISSLLCQLPEMNLKRGRSYFHSSLLAMATFNAVGPLFGCPFVTGSLPHSPQFVRALTITSPDGERRFVAEGRVAPLLMYLMIGLPLLLPKTLEHIPEAAIDGILAYVGYEGIVATGLWARITLMFTPVDEFPPRYAGMRPLRVHLYTMLQLIMFAICWRVNLSPLGLCVAFVVVSLVPLREYLLPFLFTASELATLDRDEDSAAAEDERPSAMVDIVDEVSSSEKYDLVGSPGNPLD